MIKYSNEEGFIKAEKIKSIDGKNRIDSFPEIAIGVFSHHLYEDVISKFPCEPVGILSTANMERKVYKLNYKGKEITFFMAGVSAPWIAGDIEELHASGVNKFIIFGNCGVLDSKIEDCSIIIPTKGFRDEGTSYHYIEDDSEIIDMDLKYKDKFIEILNEYYFDHTQGYTWTTDAIYRETKEKVNYYKQKGAVCVEMEGTAIAAVCKKLNIDYFTFYYAGDNLDAAVWDERSLSGLTKIDKKKEVMTLALELSRKI